MQLIIENLNKTYPGGVLALDDVSLTIPKGMFGLLGPNGAGKSTLMRTVATLQTADSGRVRLGEIDVLEDKTSVRKILGYLPQEFGVYPRTSAVALLTHLATLKGVGTNSRDRRDVVESLLDRVNLSDVRHKSVSTYSGGMRQRFGIAQALLGDPQLLIVDEPTAGLDPEERNRFLNLLAEIGENVVIILSTHIVEDVADLCPRMAVLAGGRIQLQGAPHDLIARARGTVWARSIDRADLASFSAAHEVIATRLVGGRTIVHVLSDSDPGADFTAVDGGLEDVYFATLSTMRRAAPMAA
jgi:ABC-type multidrug transport system ATPase subunit